MSKNTESKVAAKKKTKTEKFVDWWFDRTFFMSNYVWVLMSWILLAKAIFVPVAYGIGIVAMVTGTIFAYYNGMVKNSAVELEPTNGTKRLAQWFFTPLGFFPRGAWIAIAWLFIGHSVLATSAWIMGIIVMVVFMAYSWDKDLHKLNVASS